MMVDNDETAVVLTAKIDDPNTESIVDTALDTAAPTVDAVSNNDLDDFTFVKDMLHSLPPMKRDELENIVQQTSQLLLSIPITTDDGNDDPSSLLWKERTIDPFWVEYHQTRACHHSTTATTTTTDTPPLLSQSQQPLDVEQYIPHLQKQIQDYQTSQYGEKQNCKANFQVTSVQNTTTNVGSIIGSTNHIVVRTHVEYIDTANFSTASWDVEWTIQTVDEITATLSGTIRVHTHYYENNTNSQMQCEQAFVKNRIISLQEEKVNSLVAQFEKNTLSYAEKLATKLVQYIIRQEEDYYTIIVDHILSNNNADDTTTMVTTNISDQLRSLRRILPITKNKFQWNHNSHSTHQQQQTNMQLIMLQQQQQQNRNKKK